MKVAACSTVEDQAEAGTIRDFQWFDKRRLIDHDRTLLPCTTPTSFRRCDWLMLTRDGNNEPVHIGAAGTRTQFAITSQFQVYSAEIVP